MAQFKVHFSQTILMTLTLSVSFILLLTPGNGSPVFNYDNSWLDKLPSIEVKVRTDGISVKTGPSREDIYTIVGLIILGLVIFIVTSTLITLCVYKCCCPRPLMSPVVVGEAPVTSFNLLPSNRYNRPTIITPNDGMHGNSTARTHFWPRNSANSIQQSLVPSEHIKTTWFNFKPVSNSTTPFRSTS